MFHRQSNCPALSQHHDQVKALPSRLMIYSFFCFCFINAFAPFVNVIAVIVVDNNDFAVGACVV